MFALRSILAGKKTYVVGAAVILIGILEGPLGIDLPGVDTGGDWLLYILNGLGLGTLRAGVAKAILR